MINGICGPFSFSDLTKDLLTTLVRGSISSLGTASSNVKDVMSACKMIFVLTTDMISISQTAGEVEIHALIERESVANTSMRASEE
jgi:hypothetical protein